MITGPPDENEGKVVLVAGASSGMGRATALAAAEAGAKVVLFARRADALAESEKAILRSGGHRPSSPGAPATDILTVVGDATVPADTERAVQVAVDRFGRLDALINSVGTNIPQRSLRDLTQDGWRELLDTNLEAAFQLTRAVLPVFRDLGGGLLLHISSVAARRPDASGVGYQASKAGVAALAHATMEEERKNGIRVSVLYPGFTDTPLVGRRPAPPTPEELRTALQPEDVAAMCLAVLSLPARAHVPELVLVPAS